MSVAANARDQDPLEFICGMTEKQRHAAVVIRAALCNALDIAPQAALRFVIDPLSITRIDRLSDGWRLVSVNQKGF
jgi:Histidine phosphatase superfamily (branch 1)